jgi:hypothetical protein
MLKKAFKIYTRTFNLENRNYTKKNQIILLAIRGPHKSNGKFLEKFSRAKPEPRLWTKRPVYL